MKKISVYELRIYKIKNPNQVALAGVDEKKSGGSPSLLRLVPSATREAFALHL